MLYTIIKEAVMDHRCTIFFFSGTGNTWWVSHRMAEALSDRGVDTLAVSIEQVDSSQAAELCESSDLIGIGYPIYGSDLPLPMREFITGVLPQSRESTRLFVFCTQLAFSGDGAQVPRRILKAKGWKIDSSVHIIMPNNISVAVTPFFHFTNDPKRLEPKLERARKRIDRFTSRLLKTHPMRQGSFPLSSIGYLQRGPYRHFFPRLRDDIAIDEKRCTHCGRCLRLCPVGNLHEEDGRILARGECVLCLRCYNYCPVQAVTYMGREHIHTKGIPYQGPTASFTPEILIRKRNASDTRGDRNLQDNPEAAGTLSDS